MKIEYLLKVNALYIYLTSAFKIAAYVSFYLEEIFYWDMHVFLGSQSVVMLIV